MYLWVKEGFEWVKKMDQHELGSQKPKQTKEKGYCVNGSFGNQRPRPTVVRAKLTLN